MLSETTTKFSIQDINILTTTISSTFIFEVIGDEERHVYWELAVKI
jgi:hypothetical protein